jgi:hypothetical protein
MKTDYSREDVIRGFEWYHAHEMHVERLIDGIKTSFPMSGSDISRPELWKAPAWKWFFDNFDERDFAP